MSLPVTRPIGRALVVGSPGSRSQPLGILQQMGFGCAEADDPYAAMAELCRRPLVYRAVILGLTSLYREELPVIAAIKRRFPHVDVWLTQTDGRQAALADSMRLGADGLLSDDGLHRVAFPMTGAATSAGSSAASSLVGQTSSDTGASPAENTARPMIDSETAIGEPVLTADELRALLHEQTLPPGAE